ncbi:MAG: BON domain-containing protein [Gammaproteobacteria bacterium]
MIPKLMLSLLLLSFVGCATLVVGGAGESNASTQKSDAVLVSEVRGRIGGDPALGGVRVGVRDGIVSLSGVVLTDRQRSDAEQRAVSVKGVQSVDNHIYVSN